MAITPLTKKREIYSDIGKDFLLNPVSSDVSRKINEESIKESIKNLVLTDRGERLFQPNVGCDIRAMLFENFTQETVDTMRNMIFETIEAYEPRCELLGVDVTGKIDSNNINVTITFAVIINEEPITLEILLNRIR
jgi:phage baseplate assembly protein W